MELGTLEKRKAFIINAVYVILILLIAFIVFRYALALLSPFIFAFGIAYMLVRPSVFLAAKLKLPQKLVAVLLVLLFYSTIGVLIALIGVNLVTALTNLLQQLPQIYEEQLQPFLLDTFEGIEQAAERLDPSLVIALNQGFEQFVSSLGNVVSNISFTLVRGLSGIASSLPLFFIKILLMIISTFFIAGDYFTIKRFVMGLFSENGQRVVLQIKQYMVNTLFVVIRSYALIMTITFTELSIGLSLIGIKSAILIALIVAMFDILPVLGTGGIMIPWILITLLHGNYTTGVALLALYVIITIVRNIVEPKIVGSQLGLHPVLTLMSMFAGANLAGIIGLFGFPITLSLLRHLNDTGTIRLYRSGEEAR